MGTPAENAAVLAERARYSGTTATAVAAEVARARIAAMHPAYFALVMATGIVAIGSHRNGLREWAAVLAAINVVAYPVLWILLLARARWYFRELREDIGDHRRAHGFFTVVAATGVIGTHTVVIGERVALGHALWWVSVLLWAACMYGVFAALTVGERKPTLAQGINGGWLLAVVATQAVCVLGCALGGDVLGNREAGLFVLLSFWLIGGMLYLLTISLIFYRTMFFPLAPGDLMPPYWINMGAVAISTLAGALLATAAQTSVLIGPLRPFILGLTVLYWATATWWIPMLLILGVWRHRVRRLRIAYDPLYWGLVFPLGMYSVCTAALADVLGAPFLIAISRVFIVAAAAAWLLAFLGWARHALFLAMLAFAGPAVADKEALTSIPPLRTGGIRP